MVNFSGTQACLVTCFRGVNTDVSTHRSDGSVGVDFLCVLCIFGVLQRAESHHKVLCKLGL